MYERDGHTDRQTLHDDIGRACITSRGNKIRCFLLKEMDCFASAVRRCTV